MRALGIRPGDIVIFALCILIIALSTWSVLKGNPGDLAVRIRATGSEWLYPLNSEIALDIEGPAGITRVRIHGGYVWVVDSSCRDKICVQMGKTGSLHGWIACLPNQVFIQVTGNGKEDGVDGLSF